MTQGVSALTTNPGELHSACTCIFFVRSLAAQCDRNPRQSREPEVGPRLAQG